MNILRKFLHHMKYWAAVHTLDLAVRHFHDQLNQCNFERIFSAAHTEFKAARNERWFLSLLEAIHAKLGMLESSSETKHLVNSDYCPETGGWKTYFVLTYNSRYRNGDATETFTYEWELVNGVDTAILYDYKFDSWVLTKALAENTS